ncbi:hypothetical protein [Acholeplasma palmae]|uniref:hypothetical protein n=1 Tax=Acholeplasma palmae TaxID=38986 RepID=UPI000B2E8810|nr:hypothetical protein [Alteracholeplasma palmae]
MKSKKTIFIRNLTFILGIMILTRTSQSGYVIKNSNKVENGYLGPIYGNKLNYNKVKNT